MARYVCLIVGDSERLVSVSNFEALTDASACSRAMEIARHVPIAKGYELWSNGRKLAAYYGGRRACEAGPLRIRPQFSESAAQAPKLRG